MTYIPTSFPYAPEYFQGILGRGEFIKSIDPYLNGNDSLGLFSTFIEKAGVYSTNLGYGLDLPNENYRAVLNTNIKSNYLPGKNLSYFYDNLHVEIPTYDFTTHELADPKPQKNELNNVDTSPFPVSTLDSMNLYNKAITVGLNIGHNITRTIQSGQRVSELAHLLARPALEAMANEYIKAGAKYIMENIIYGSTDYDTLGNTGAKKTANYLQFSRVPSANLTNAKELTDGLGTKQLGEIQVDFVAEANRNTLFGKSSTQHNAVGISNPLTILVPKETLRTFMNINNMRQRVFDMNRPDIYTYMSTPQSCYYAPYDVHMIAVPHELLKDDGNNYILPVFTRNSLLAGYFPPTWHLYSEQMAAYGYQPAEDSQKSVLGLGFNGGFSVLSEIASPKVDSKEKIVKRLTRAGFYGMKLDPNAITFVKLPKAKITAPGTTYEVSVEVNQTP